MSATSGSGPSTGRDFILELVAADAWMMAVLRTARGLDLADWWIGAGFVRNKVWDALHDYTKRTPLADIDVLYFDPAEPSREREVGLEAALQAASPGLPWSVRNQARMHLRNQDPPYRDTTDAMRHWLETATPVAVTLDGRDQLQLAAPLGLDDLLALRLRPAPAGQRRAAQYIERVRAKNWTAQWPKLRVEMPEGNSPERE